MIFGAFVTLWAAAWAAEDSCLLQSMPSQQLQVEELQRKELETGSLLESASDDKEKEAKMKLLEAKIAEMQAELEKMRSAELQRKELETESLLEKQPDDKEKEAMMRSLEAMIAKMQAELEAMRSTVKAAQSTQPAKSAVKVLPAQPTQPTQPTKSAVVSGCPPNTEDFSYNWTDTNFPTGSLTIGNSIAPNIKLLDFFTDTGGSDECIGAAIWTAANNDPTSPQGDTDLLTCPDFDASSSTNCNMLVAQQKPTDESPSGSVNDCAPTGNQYSNITLQFETATTLIGLNFWDIESDNGADVEWVTLSGVTGQVDVPGNNVQSGAPSEVTINIAEVDTFSIIFRGSGGNNGLRFCLPLPLEPTSTTSPGGGVIGDPHIHTMDGAHYLLLSQGSFSLWRFAGPTVHSSKTAVDWQIYTHYSGHQSFTKALLLVDQTGGEFQQALELTSQDCVWRSKRKGQDWAVVQQPQLFSAEGTGFNITSRKHVRLYMNTKEGPMDKAVLSYSCRPNHNINLNIKMAKEEDIKFVQGAARKASGASMLQMTDDEFHLRKSWTALGGSAPASMYLESMDEPGASFVGKCEEPQKADAAKICAKHLGEKMQKETGANADFFGDCVFDVCMGAGEVAAELAAELVASTSDIL